MITIRCAHCRKKIFKYNKIGKGRILYCWKERIKEDYTKREGDKVLCECGKLIGIDEKIRIRMKQNSFIYSGHIKNK